MNRRTVIALFTPVLALLFLSSAQAQIKIPDFLGTSSSSSSSSSGKVVAKKDDGKPRNPEEQKLFNDLRMEVKACNQDLFESRRQSCLTGKYKKGVPVVDRKCERRLKVLVELECEKKVRSNIPYKSKPQWDLYRAGNIERAQKKLDKLSGKKVVKERKKKKPVYRPGEGEWVKEFD
jgi:hypothetical protein